MTAYNAAIWITLAIISMARVARAEYAYTIQVQGSGGNCEEAVMNARQALSGSEPLTAVQIASTEFQNIQQANEYCLASTGTTPPEMAEGPWLPVGTLALPSGDEDERCSVDQAGNFHTQQKFYGACPVEEP